MSEQTTDVHPHTRAQKSPLGDPIHRHQQAGFFPKEERCPDWCAADHDTDPEFGAHGYMCTTGATIIELPATGLDNGVMGRRNGVKQQIRVTRARWTVEDPDAHCGQAAGDTIEIGVENDDAVGLNADEARLLIAVLQFHVDQVEAARAALRRR